jgi:PAS domain S-box-containing protein
MTTPFEIKETVRASLELLYTISRELTSALDLRTVLERVLVLSMKNTGAINGSLIVLDERGQPFESIIIVGDQLIENTTAQLKGILDRGLAGWVVRNNEGALLPDTTQDERWLRRPDDDASRTGAKSAISVPLVVRDQLAGVMTLVHPTPGTFARPHLDLLQAIADQAGAAVLNARLYDESLRRASVMTALAESATAITASLELDVVLSRILEQISLALRVEAVSLALIDVRGERLKFLASSAGSGSNVIGMELAVGEGIAGWVAKEGQGIIIPEAADDPRFAPEVDQITGYSTHAIACAPLRSRGKVSGILEAINPKEGYFDPNALEVLTGIGSLAGTAIENARLFEQLQATQHRYRELFEDSVDSIIITDWDGSILESNRQTEIASGYSKENLSGMPISRIHLIDYEKVGMQFEQLRSGETISYESELHTNRGSPIPMQVHARSVIIDGESLLQWILRNVTERKNLDRLREDLISMIYHDLRSPLSNIVSSLDVFNAMLPSDGDPAYSSLLNIALRSTERIQRLTNSLLDMNRLESGQPIVNRFATSLHLLARDALDAISPTAENKNVNLHSTISAEIPQVFVDADMIRRVLINLLENAVKFTPSGGEVTLEAGANGSWAQLCVADSGPGIPHFDQERIFDKYTRLNPKDESKGFGLGLAYCRLAVEGHGGKIWVESEPGQGSRFFLTLPLAGS